MDEFIKLINGEISHYEYSKILSEHITRNTTETKINKKIGYKKYINKITK